jgi:iron complex outermembrane recepter protein
MSLSRCGLVRALLLAALVSPAPVLAESDAAAPAFRAIAAAREDRVAQADEGDLQPAPRTPDNLTSPAQERVQPLGQEEMIGDLITTARRRNEMVQSTPAAVTALGREQLAVREVRRLTDLDGLVPNLVIDNALGAAATGRLTIRGVGQFETTTSFDPAVGLYVDGAYVPRAQGQIGPLFDIERVEVVRGPQGTLFGKNTIGGAINVVTRRPDFEFGGDASLRVGNLGRFDTRATVNVPLIDERAAARITVASNYDDGYQSNQVLDERLGTDRLLGTRAELLLLPSSDVEILLTGQYTREDRRPQGGKCVVTGNPSATVSAVLGPDLSLRTRQGCDQDQVRSDRKVASDLSSDDDFRVTHLTGQISWELSDAIMIKSITSYRKQDYDIQQDLDATAFALAQSFFDSGAITNRSISQELQLSGRGMSDRLFYVVGLFAFGEETDDDTPGGASLLAEELQRQGSFVLPLVRENRDVDNRSYAAYGSLTYAITEQLSVTAGLRRTLERRRLRKQDLALTPGLLPRQLGPGDTVFDFERSSRFDDFSPNASLSYTVSPNVLTYASYSTGFRSGGFNGRANVLNQDTREIDPEKLTSYEIGIKSSLLDSRLLINAATFYSIFEDIQRPIIGADVNGLIATIVTNAAEARLRGAEIEIAALPFTGLRLDSSIGAFRARYTDFDSLDDPGIENARLPGQPSYLASFATTYQFPVAVGLLSTRVQWTYRGQQANDAKDSRSVRSGKYGLLDARMSLELTDGRTELVLFGSNLLDREYFNNGLDATDSAGRAIRFQGQPRRYGVEVRREF